MFEDGSRWPPAPADPPTAHYNYGEADVSGLMYFVEFLYGKGKQLGTNNSGYHGNTEKPFLKSGNGSVPCVGKTQPAGTEQVQLRLTHVFFADETLWKVA